MSGSRETQPTANAWVIEVELRGLYGEVDAVYQQILRIRNQQPDVVEAVSLERVDDVAPADSGEALKP